VNPALRFVVLLLWVWSPLSWALSWQTLADHWPDWQANPDFVELRYDGLLDLETRYQGRFIALDAEGFKVTYSTPDTMDIERRGDELTLRYPQREQRISLSQQPGLASFFTLFEGLLVGQFSLLEADYKGVIQQDGTRWQLRWQRQSALSNNPLQFIIEGSGQQPPFRLHRVRVVLSQGDWREFQFSHLDE
jgi:hypothetical protein